MRKIQHQKKKKMVKIKDVISNVIKSKNYSYYVNKINSDSIQTINNEKYISEQILIDFLRSCRNDNAKTALDTITDTEFTKNNFKFDIDNNIITYDNNHITILSCDNEVWFRAKDLAIMLGYSSTRKINDHVDEENICRLCELNESDYRKNSPIYINESGFYSLILDSDESIARSFKKWITNCVLPSIRKTGIYDHKKEINKMKKEIKRIKEEKDSKKNQKLSDLSDLIEKKKKVLKS